MVSRKRQILVATIGVCTAIMSYITISRSTPPSATPPSFAPPPLGELFGWAFVFGMLYGFIFNALWDKYLPAPTRAALGKPGRITTAAGSAALLAGAGTALVLTAISAPVTVPVILVVSVAAAVGAALISWLW